MSEEYLRIMERVRELEREHFKEPCHPARCSHRTTEDHGCEVTA